MFRAQRVNAESVVASAVRSDPVLRERFARARQVSDVTSLGPLAVDAAPPAVRDCCWLAMRQASSIR